MLQALPSWPGQILPYSPTVFTKPLPSINDDRVSMNSKCVTQNAEPGVLAFACCTSAIMNVCVFALMPVGCRLPDAEVRRMPVNACLHRRYRRTTRFFLRRSSPLSMRVVTGALLLVLSLSCSTSAWVQKYRAIYHMVTHIPRIARCSR